MPGGYLTFAHMPERKGSTKEGARNIWSAVCQIMRAKMKYATVALISIFLLTGCASLFRSKGEPYSGYSCRESLMHFYSQCSQEKLTKVEFEAKVQLCEKELATHICDKEQADLLWCMGRVAPGMYSSGGGMIYRGLYSGHGSMTDGCNCSTYQGEIKKCRMQKGIFDK